MTQRRASQIARIGALTMHSRHNAQDITSPARRAFMARFELEVDPRGELTEQERARRASYARRALMSKLALARANARRRSKSTTNKAAVVQDTGGLSKEVPDVGGHLT